MALYMRNAGSIASVGILGMLVRMAGIAAAVRYRAECLFHVETEPIAMMVMRKYADSLHDDADGKQYICLDGLFHVNALFFFYRLANIVIFFDCRQAFGFFLLYHKRDEHGAFLSGRLLMDMRKVFHGCAMLRLYG